MTEQRWKELQRVLSAHRAGLGGPGVPSLESIAEEALDALGPLLVLLEAVRGPVGALTEALEQYAGEKD